MMLDVNKVVTHYYEQIVHDNHGMWTLITTQLKTFDKWYFEYEVCNVGILIHVSLISGLFQNIIACFELMRSEYRQALVYGIQIPTTQPQKLIFSNKVFS